MKAAVGLFLVLAACASPAEEPDRREPLGEAWRVLVDPAVPEADYREVVAAAADWVAVVPCPPRVEVARGALPASPEEEPPPFVVHVREGFPAGWLDGVVGRAWVKAPGGGARVVLLPPFDPGLEADFPRVVRHELGHALMGDDHGGGGVMADPPVAVGARLGPDDARMFARKWCPERL